jgi:hypothetical protein
MQKSSNNPRITIIVKFYDESEKARFLSSNELYVSSCNVNFRFLLKILLSKNVYLKTGKKIFVKQEMNENFLRNFIVWKIKLSHHSLSSFHFYFIQ